MSRDRHYPSQTELDYKQAALAFDASGKEKEIIPGKRYCTSAITHIPKYWLAAGILSTVQVEFPIGAGHEVEVVNVHTNSIGQKIVVLKTETRVPQVMFRTEEDGHLTLDTFVPAFTSPVEIHMSTFDFHRMFTPVEKSDGAVDSEITAAHQDITDAVQY